MATVDVEDFQGHSDDYFATSCMTTGKSHEESWMINLGRGNVNAWLTGVRSDEWFTGVIPSKCPGKFLKGSVSGIEVSSQTCRCFADVSTCPQNH